MLKEEIENIKRERDSVAEDAKRKIAELEEENERIKEEFSNLHNDYTKLREENKVIETAKNNAENECREYKEKYIKYEKIKKASKVIF